MHLRCSHLTAHGCLRQACELLLEYCLMDLDLGRKEDVAKLANLPLVAMADGGVFETLKLSKEADKELYVMSPREAELLSNQSQRIVSWHVSLPLPCGAVRPCQ